MFLIAYPYKYKIKLHFYKLFYSTENCEPKQIQIEMHMFLIRFSIIIKLFKVQFVTVPWIFV